MATIGTDPEFTVFDDKGRPVPAHAVGFNTRDNNPLTVDTVNGVAVAFRDGFNIEINVPPGDCRGNMMNSVRKVLKTIINNNLPKGYTLRAQAAFEINPVELVKTAPEDVQHFGCSPSLCAYTGLEKAPALDGASHPYRYAGGHLHFGSLIGTYGAKAIVNPENHRDLVKMFDLFIGVPLAYIYDDPGQWNRREWYGQAGEYRHQKYDPDHVGVEYRVPPPELFNQPALCTLFFGVGRTIVTHFDTFRSQCAAYLKSDNLQQEVRDAINKGINTEKWLQTFPGYYSPENIKAVKQQSDVHTFTIVETTYDLHTGWTEYLSSLGMVIPPVRINDYVAQYEIVLNGVPVTNTPVSAPGEVAAAAPPVELEFGTCKRTRRATVKRVNKAG